MAALWVRKQSEGHTKLVLLGRPKRAFDQFALVISTGQFRVPPRPNVLQLDFPLMRVDGSAIAAAADEWGPRFAAFTRPLVALLIGGPTKPFVMDAKVAGRLLKMAQDSMAESGGTLYLTTSRRTLAAVVDVLERGLPAGAILYRWQSDNPENPYRGLLGLADRFIVTGDSISMMVEVARLGKPLAIFPLPNHPGIVTRTRQALARSLHRSAGEGGKPGLMTYLGDVLYSLGLVRYSRDLTALHGLLIEQGLAVKLGDPFPVTGLKAPDELPQVVKRIKALYPKIEG